MAKNDNLPPKKRKAIAAILAQPTMQQAAKAAGISERQLYRWLDMPEFQAELKAAENELIDAAGKKLSAGLEVALTALLELITGAESEAVRRLAAADWLNQAFKVYDLRTLAARMDEIERRLNNGQR